MLQSCNSFIVCWTLFYNQDITIVRLRWNGMKRMSRVSQIEQITKFCFALIYVIYEAVEICFIYNHLIYVVRCTRKNEMNFHHTYISCWSKWFTMMQFKFITFWDIFYCLGIRWARRNMILSRVAATCYMNELKCR